MRRSFLLALVVIAITQFGVGQCSSDVRYLNIYCSCNGAIFLETLAVGSSTTSGYSDGQTACGWDDFGNPCYAGYVQSCSSGQLMPNSRHKPVLARNRSQKVLVLPGNDYKRLAALVPFCGGAAQNRSREFTLPPASLNLR